LTPEKYSEWAKFHADLFNLRDPADARLFSIWAPMLMPFEFKELRDASYVVATDPSDKRRFRENHLAMLREAMLAKRAEASARERDRLDRLYASADCKDCFGVGFVRVPHPDWIVDGELERPFHLVVACPCPAGTSRFNAINARLFASEAKIQIKDLAQYETLVPDWRNILAASADLQARELEGEELARKVDRDAPIDAAAVSRKITKGGTP
jgi:hypothetical protein